MTDLKNHTDAEVGKTQPPRLVAVTVEELVVYRYHVPADADDPEGIALDRFRNGELPDAGPTEGEQHDLSTYFVGDVEPTPPSDFDDWADTYCPLKNTIRPDAPCDGLMFETFGAELEAVQAVHPGCVWTLVSGDDDTLIILSGFHTVNRLGYIVTEFYWPGDNVVEIPYV